MFSIFVLPRFSKMFNKVSNKLDGKGKAPKRDDHEKYEFRDGDPPDIHDSPLIEINGMERSVPKNQGGDDKPHDVGSESLYLEASGPECDDHETLNRARGGYTIGLHSVQFMNGMSNMSSILSQEGSVHQKNGHF